MIHDLAISIFEGLHGSRYQNKPHEGPENPVHPDFRHPKYVHSRVYPRGPIELVGYWIEMRLFGGVVVFEHGNPPGEVSQARQHSCLQHLFSSSFPANLFFSDTAWSTLDPFPLQGNHEAIQQTTGRFHPACIC